MRAPDYSCLWSSICYFCLYLSVNGYHEYLATHKQETGGVHACADFGDANVRSCHRSGFSPGWVLSRELCPLVGNSHSLAWRK